MSLDALLHRGLAGGEGAGVCEGLLPLGEEEDSGGVPFMGLGSGLCRSTSEAVGAAKEKMVLTWTAWIEGLDQGGRGGGHSERSRRKYKVLEGGGSDMQSSSCCWLVAAVASVRVLGSIFGAWLAAGCKAL